MEKKSLGQSVTLPIQPKSVSPDNKLLLLGLQLLSKGLKVPCAVLPPQNQELPLNVKYETSPPNSPSKDSGSEDSEVGSLDSNTRKRKREGNSELTEKEKREKRKMMNRVAAQNARDRKKSYIEDLEKKVALLEQQNRQLQVENHSLKQQTSTLTTEKKQLELCLADSLQTDLLSGIVKKECPQETPIRSAAPGVVSLQQKQLLRASLLQFWMSFSLTYWLTSFKKEDLQNLLNSEEILSMEWVKELPASNTQLLRLPQWWGASDSKWNPPRN